MAHADRQAMQVEFDAAKLTSPGPLCPVDRLPSRRRNKICLLIISVGAVNFLLYTITYAMVGGDAPNGHSAISRSPDGEAVAVFFVRGHFIRSLEGKERQVTKWLWVYSYLHSITLPLTGGAMIVSMLVLARPHILATMRGSRFGGRTFVVTFSTLVIAISLWVAFVFSWDFAAELSVE